MLGSLGVTTITSALQELPSLPSVRKSEANSAVGENEQGAIKYLAGYVAHRLRANHPNLKVLEQRGTMAPMSWVTHLARVPSGNWREECTRLESHFFSTQGNRNKANYVSIFSSRIIHKFLPKGSDLFVCRNQNLY